MKEFIIKWRVLLLLMIFQSVASVLVMWAGDFSKEAHRSSITFTMRYCTVLFFFIYSARGLQVIFNTGWSRFLLANRKSLGIAFAYSFTFHLFQLALLHDTIEMSPLMFGLQLIPIAFINLMGLTSIPVIEKNMSRKLWKGIHQLGAIVIWIALAKNYLLIYFVPSLLGDRDIFYLGSVLVAIMPVIRIYLLYRKHQPIVQP